MLAAIEALAISAHTQEKNALERRLSVIGVDRRSDLEEMPGGVAGHEAPEEYTVPTTAVPGRVLRCRTIVSGTLELRWRVQRYLEVDVVRASKHSKCG